MKRRIALRVLFAVCLACSAAAQGIRIATVEFELKNEIGLENAGVILGELVATEIAKTGGYQVQERLLLQKILEEQELMLSGAIDEGQAARIGELYGVEAIVSGSAMRIGSRIVVTGRLLNIQSGQVLKTAQVSLESLDQLELEARVLANALSDIPREAFEVREDLARRSFQRFELGGGLGWASSDTGGLSLDLNMLFRYSSRFASAWVEGSPPVGAVPDIQVGLVLNPFDAIGLGACAGLYFDNATDYVEVSYLLFGFLARPRLNVEFGIFVGGSLSGVVWTDDSGPVEDIPGTWRLVANYDVWLQYRVNETISIRARYLGVGLDDFQDELPLGYYYPDGDYEYVGGKFTLAVLYSFVVGR